MSVEKRVYAMRQEFFPLLGINYSQWVRRKEDLLEWFKNFFDYEIIEKVPLSIQIKEIYGEYKPLPRKLQNNCSEKAMEAYREYVDKNLPKEFAYESKARMSRNAIKAFGKEEFNHTNAEAVTRRYVGPAMEELGEKKNDRAWCNLDTYEPLTDAQVESWKGMLKKHKIDEANAANAFYKAQRGEDISLEKLYYKQALEEFAIAYGITPVLLTQWKHK